MRRGKWSRRLAFGLTAVCLLAGVYGCAGLRGAKTADEAFALSVSALSGADDYAFGGEISIFAEGGRTAERAAYRGVVAGHGNVRMSWNRAVSVAAYEPLTLLGLFSAAAVSYAPSQETPEQLRFRVTVPVAAATERMRGLLRREGRPEAELATLRAETVCEWTAEKRSWRPLQMTERTVLAYRRDGLPRKESREAVTYFLLDGGQGGTETAGAGPAFARAGPVVQ